METINIKRILSESTLSTIKAEIEKYAGRKRYSIYLGQAQIGSHVQSDVEMLDSIINIVCKHYKANRAIVVCKTRKLPYMRYRQLIIYLARKYTKLRLAEIGNIVGDFDHATVIHSIKTTENYMRGNKIFLSQLEDIEQKILLLFDNETFI